MNLPMLFLGGTITVMGIGAWLLGTARHFDERAGGTFVMTAGMLLAALGVAIFTVGTL